MSNAESAWLFRRWIAVLFLLWSFAGLAAFIMQWRLDLSELAKADPYQARIFAEMPGWVWVVYAIAVLSAAISALLLVLRRKGAVLVSAIEVIAVVAQFGYTLGATDLIAIKGIVTAATFPLVIFVLAVLQLLYARWLASKGALA